MNVYIWKRIEQASSSYHSEGGVTAIATTEERARELALTEGAKIQRHESPDIVQAVADGAPEVAVVFPDAGCC